jgi:hypothetical protein
MGKATKTFKVEPTNLTASVLEGITDRYIDSEIVPLQTFLLDAYGQATGRAVMRAMVKDNAMSKMTAIEVQKELYAMANFTLVPAATTLAEKLREFSLEDLHSGREVVERQGHLPLAKALMQVLHGGKLGGLCLSGPPNTGKSVFIDRCCEIFDAEEIAQKADRICIGENFSGGKPV